MISFLKMFHRNLQIPQETPAIAKFTKPLSRVIANLDGLPVSEQRWFSVACGEYCILFQFCLPDNVKMVQEKAASYMQCAFLILVFNI